MLMKKNSTFICICLLAIISCHNLVKYNFKWKCTFIRQQLYEIGRDGEFIEDNKIGHSQLLIGMESQIPVNTTTLNEYHFSLISSSFLDTIPCIQWFPDSIEIYKNRLTGNSQFYLVVNTKLYRHYDGLEDLPELSSKLTLLYKFNNEYTNVERLDSLIKSY